MHIKRTASHLSFLKESLECGQSQPGAVGYIPMIWQGRLPRMMRLPQRVVGAFGYSAWSSGLGRAECEGLKPCKPGVLKAGWMAARLMARSTAQCAGKEE